MGRPCIASAVKRRRIHLLRPNIDAGRAGLPSISWQQVKDFLTTHPQPDQSLPTEPDTVPPGP